MPSSCRSSACRLLFTSEREDNTRNLFWQAADGTGDVERLTESPNQQHATAVSPDGRLLIFSEDAPALESSLHRQFQDRRVNLVNRRKEFFRVSVQELSQFMDSSAHDVELTLLAEAKEYRETLAILEQRKAHAEVLAGATESSPEAFPESPF